MMKNFRFLILFLFLYVSVFSQQKINFQYIIQGTVTEHESQKPIKGAVVRLAGSDNSLIEVKTNGKGYYKFLKSNVLSNISYVISTSAIDVKSKDFPDGLLGNPKMKISTVNIKKDSIFVQNFILAKILGCGWHTPLVVFQENKSEYLNKTMLDSVEFMAKIIKAHPNMVFEIAGCAGLSEVNAVKLTLERAGIVKKQMKRFGINSKRLVISGLVQADSLITNEQKQSYFYKNTPIEQYKTRILFYVLRKDYPDFKTQREVPKVKVITGEEMKNEQNND